MASSVQRVKHVRVLQACKLPYLKGMQQHLQRLAGDRTLREGLASFPFSPDAEEAILPNQRSGEIRRCEPPMQGMRTQTLRIHS